MITFTEEDLFFIKQRGSDEQAVVRQFDYFLQGFPKVQLIAPATVEKGIVQWEENTIEELVDEYDSVVSAHTLLKFVPASGAASRMFQSLFELYNSPEQSQKGADFLHLLPKFPFYDALKVVMGKSAISLEETIASGDYHLVLHYLLLPDGLNYSNLPKGLILFNQYDDQCRTAVEEHLCEAAHYAAQPDRTCPIHFTISPQHLPLFQQHIKEVLPEYESRFHLIYEISYSIQNPATDTLAATPNNLPFRDLSENLLFRPGGHGALIHNLNRLDADIIFVKNIDNVVIESDLDETIQYKKALASYLIYLQRRVFEYLHQLKNKEVDPFLLMEIADFATSELMIEIDPSASLTAKQLFELLNRPIRICGMVKNEGEPGGGPFYVKNQNGDVSLQIVESSQIDLSDSNQKAIFDASTHFNPVDMVCGIKNYIGEKFDLLRFVDPQTGFIAAKSYEGKPLKAMELPGLWNGAMAQWITIFVEVPITTFHPVKTVFDLIPK
ncbi:MAG: DUF4301 family protein [Bacteroidales bacterium]|jgi:hypothetical protein|nr:DUF4301 family protein [Bacteroidales bacterium]